MTGKITMPHSQYAEDAPLDMNNSDIRGLNQLIFSDPADSKEGFVFPRTNSNIDLLKLYNGRLILDLNIPDEASTGTVVALNKWIDITSYVTFTATSSSGSYTISYKKVWLCGCFIKVELTIVFNYTGTAGTNPLKLRMTSNLFTTEHLLSRTYFPSFYGTGIWTIGFNTYDGETNIFTFRPNHNFVVGEDASFSGIIAVNTTGVS